MKLDIFSAKSRFWLNVISFSRQKLFHSLPFHSYLLSLVIDSKYVWSFDKYDPAPSLLPSSKLMRLDRPPAKTRSKSYSNWLLIDFFDPISAVRSIVATISIQNPDYLDRLQSNFNQNRSKMTGFHRFNIVLTSF